MMRFLQHVPYSGVEDFYERVKLAMTWRLCLVSVVILLPIIIVSYVNDFEYFPHYSVVFIFLLLGVIYIKRYKRYRIVSIIVSLVATLAIIRSLFFVEWGYHIVETMWMVVVILFSFFTLGKWWGVFYLCINALVFAVYFNTRLMINLTTDNPILNSEVMYKVLTFEFVMSLILIGYIMLQFHNVNKHSEREKIKAVKDLNQKQLILDQKNKEKTALLQEIHHRVKNNLQVIISLLRMQSAELKSKEAIDSFDEAINRIMTMSLIHQKMYEKESIATIDLESYVKTLVSDILVSTVTRTKVNFYPEINQKIIGAKTIVPLGLIINELVTNSLKHAFEKGEGVIKLKIDKIEGERFNVYYMDDGKWRTPENGSFGLQLIKIFTEQLEGDMKRTIDEEGTHYRFKFKCLDS